MALTLYGCDFSPNVERVELALAHKGLDCERVWIDLADRSLVRSVSGQDRVPVLDDDGDVVAGSMAIVAHLDRRFPDPPLTPRDDSVAAAGVASFLTWFDGAWKGALNGLIDELLRGAPDATAIDHHAVVLADGLDRLEVLLAGRDFLFGPLTAADIAAYPFVGRAAGLKSDDDALAELVMRDYQRLGDHHPRVRAWIARLDATPAGYGIRSPQFPRRERRVGC
jgi:glutathione S-transferase